MFLRRSVIYAALEVALSRFRIASSFFVLVSVSVRGLIWHRLRARSNNMNNPHFTRVRAAAFAIASFLFATLACPAQTKTRTSQPQKSSDPSIRWQFNTHG